MNLWRVPVDEATGLAKGNPEPVTTPSSNSALITISADGKRLAYVEQSWTQNLMRVAFPPGSRPDPPTPVTQGSRFFTEPQVSPDGQWLATYSLDNEQQPLRGPHRRHGVSADHRRRVQEHRTAVVARWEPDRLLLQPQRPVPGVVDPPGRQRPAPGDLRHRQRDVLLPGVVARRPAPGLQLARRQPVHPRYDQALGRAAPRAAASAA